MKPRNTLIIYGLSLFISFLTTTCKPAPYCNIGDGSNHCRMMQTLLQGIGAAPQILYAGSPFTFALNKPITVIPDIEITNCAVSPSSLPAGLVLTPSTCVISGIPTVAQPDTSYTITATRNGGNISGALTISIGPDVIYTWGTFIDRMNGTVLFTGSGTGSNGENYVGQTLLFMKCSQGQVWNATTNDCTGTGAPSSYGAGTYKFCSTDTNDCNGGILTNALGVGGFLNGATSQAYDTCNGLNNLGIAGKTTWRVPNHAELKTLIQCNDLTMPIDANDCGSGNYTAPTVSSLFPNTVIGSYFSASSGDAANGWYIAFNTGNNNYSLAPKSTTAGYIRCIANW